MRNPHRKIFVYLLMSIVAVAMTAYGVRAEERFGEDWTRTSFVVVGLTLAPFGFVFLINALLFARGRAKLLAGRDILARWHVTADEWERFRVIDRLRGEQDPAFFNDLPVFKGRQDRGIDVIIGKKSALVGDSYHVLRKGGLPGLTAIYWLPAPADPECLEFHIVYPRYRSTPVRLAFRIPFPAYPAALFAAVVGTILAPVALFLALLTARWQHVNRAR